MNKTLYFFIGGLCMVVMPAMAAVSVKKAAPVAMQQTEKLDGAGNLLGTAVNLVAGVQALTKQVDALSAECYPTSSEIVFVNKLMQEYAKTGAVSADEMAEKLGRTKCSDKDGYANSVREAVQTRDSDICFNFFDEDGKIWHEYPRVGTAEYCDDGEERCGDKHKKKVSDIYEIFDKIDFEEKDYTADELKTASKLIEKSEKCGGAKVAQAKNALLGQYVKDTVGNLGQKTNTGSIMETVSTMVGSGGGSMGGLSSIGAFITNTVNK